jgi:hypothetical protein
MPGTHAILSPSKSKQWMACPPSARLNAKLAERFGEQSSEYAAEGTKAHALAELKLRQELGEINKFSYESQRKALGEIPKEMDRYTDDYFDNVLGMYYEAKRTCPDAQLFVEQRLDMSPWIPSCFGTGDAVIVSDDILIVADLKYGKGVPVVAEHNPQARCYGLGAYNAFGSIYSFKTIRNVIIQPRLDSVTEETLSLEDLLAWGEEVKPLAAQAWRGDGEFHTGDHCRFCNARAICKARVFESFDVLTHCVDSPDVLPDELVPELLRIADTAEAWLKDLKAYALAQALLGQEWAGYKVVRGKRPARAFRDAEEAEQQLIRAGYTPEQYMKSSMKSVAEVEKLMGKSAFKAIMGEQVVQGEGGFTLVPESDKRTTYEAADLAFADMGEIADG